MQDGINFEMYPFVSKEEFNKYKRLYDEEKVRNDDLHNKLDLFNYALSEGKIKDTKLTEVMKQNIMHEIKIKSQEKKMQDLKESMEKLKHNIKRMENEKTAEETRVKMNVQKWINVEESTKQKVKLLEEIDFKLKKAQKEFDEIQKIKISVIKEIKGYLPPEEQKITLLNYKPREEKRIYKTLKQIERKINAPLFKERNKEKARHLLFEVKQSISFMDEKQKEAYSKEIKRLENAI